MIEMIFTAIAIPLIAASGKWIVSVEKRFSRFEKVEETVDRMDGKLDQLTEHLIGRPQTSRS